MPCKSGFYVWLFCLLLWAAQLSAQSGIDAQLNELKKQNKLEDWLYERMDYSAADPQHRLPFLMATAQQAWRKPNTTAEQLAWLTLLSNQGYYQLLNGDILRSINCYEDAYTWFYRYRLTQFELVEYVLKPLSNNYTRLGDYERAIYIQQKTIDRLNPVTDADNMASVYCNMAIACYSMGDYAAARAAIARGNRLTQNVLVKLRLQNILADIFYDEGQFAQASTILKNTLAQVKATDAETAYAVTGTYTTLGKINIKQNELTLAAQQFKQAQQLLNRYYEGARLREKANLMGELGKVERLQQHPQQALKLLDDALQMLRINTATNKTLANNIYGENELVDIFHEKANCYALLNQDTAALQNLQYALLATDRIRREFADNKTKERLQHDGKDLAEEAIATAYRLYQHTHYNRYAELILQIAEQTKARTLADELQQNSRQLINNGHDTVLRHKRDLERAIVYNERMLMGEQHPEQYRDKIAALKFEAALLNKQHHIQTDAAVLSSEQMLSALPDSLHVVEYFFGTRAVYSIDIKHRKIDRVNRMDDPAGLQGMVQDMVGKYYSHGPNKMLNEPEAFYKLSHTIYATLFQNISLKKNDRLCVVPDDVLGYLSFDGLITGGKYEPAFSQWPYLIKQVTASYAFSLNTLLQNKVERGNNGVFSCLFITHQNSKPIVAVKQEAKAISKLVSGNYSYDEEVNNAVFFKAFDEASVLHISTHAYLSGQDKEPTLDLGKKQLYLFELLARQHRPQLVVLGACRTGDGLLAKGEGIISLARGFGAIGTPATIAGLWNVNDDAAAQITAGLYEGMLARQTPGTALHSAKLNWLTTTKTNDALYLPYYWDSLILMGNDAPVHLQPAQFGWLWPLIGLGSLLLVCCIYWFLLRKRAR